MSAWGCFTSFPVFKIHGGRIVIAAAGSSLPSYSAVLKFTGG